MTVSAVPPPVVAAATAAAKAWLRLPAGGAASEGDEDALAALATSAIVLAEAFCGRILVTRPVRETMVPDTRWRPLAGLPVATIDEVAAVAGDGTTTPLAAGDYAIDIDAGGTGWVRLTRPLDGGRIAVGYRAGDAGGWDDLPAPIAQGIAMLVAHLFDHRDGEQAPPAAVAALWRRWRRIVLGGRAHA